MALVGSVAGSLVAGGVSTVPINQLFSGSDKIIQVYYGFSNLIQTRYVSSAVSPSAFSSTLGTDTRIRTDQIRQEYVSLKKIKESYLTQLSLFLPRWQPGILNV